MNLKKIGIGFIVFAIIWSLLNRFMCISLCPFCTSKQISPCFYLFLFVGIIFMICGLSLIKIKEKKLPKITLMNQEGEYKRIKSAAYRLRNKKEDAK